MSVCQVMSQRYTTRIIVPTTPDMKERTMQLMFYHTSGAQFTGASIHITT